VLADLGARERVPVIVEGHTFYEVMSATLAKGGRARNVVAESFELNVNYRFAPGKAISRAQQDVHDFVAGRAQVSFVDLAPSGRLCGQNPWFQSLEKLSGRPAEAKQAWTDVARFSELGVDAVNFGPGETAQAHQRSESASVSALQRSYDVLQALLTAPLR
jgi:succinyl-diaminopimelate desuccinylase